MPEISSAQRQTNLLSAACAVMMVAALCLGGGTHSGFLGDAALQFLSIPLLAMAMLISRAQSFQSFRWIELALCACILAVPLLQIMDVPPSIWMGFPFRTEIVEALQLTGHEQAWMPLSVFPEGTALAALSLMPPLSVFLAMRQLNCTQRRMVVVAVLVVSACSVLLGLAQIAGGQDSNLRFFEITNPTEAVGFFANRNHFSALLYMSLPFTGAWAIDSGLTLFNARGRNRLEPQQVIAFVASVTLMFCLGAAQVMARSRAGMALTIVAMIGVAAMTVIDRRNNARKASLQLLGLVSVAAVLSTAQFGFLRFAERLVNVDPINDTRLTIGRISMEAARTFFPFGSGIGSFQKIYAMFEKPEQLMPNAYANHAHNDFIELWLESGVPGMVVLTLVLIWIGWQSVRVWARPDRRQQPIDHLVARAASLATGLVILHSLVDYPLHTSALLAFLAMCCGLLAPANREQELLEVDVGPMPSRNLNFAAGELRPIALPVRPRALPQYGVETVWPEIGRAHV